MMNLTLSLFTLLSVSTAFATESAGVTPAEIKACEESFVARLAETQDLPMVPLAQLDRVIARHAPNPFGDGMSYVAWSFFPGGEKMIMQVNSSAAVTRFMDVGVVTTLVITADGWVGWQQQRAGEDASPLGSRRIDAEKARAVIAYAYLDVHLDPLNAQRALRFVVDDVPFTFWPRPLAAQVYYPEE